jgi:hypothetical protein
VQITTSYGVQNKLTRDFPVGTTVGAIRQDASLQTALGFSTNVQAIVNGAAVSDDYVLGEGNVLSFEDRAARKA